MSTEEARASALAEAMFYFNDDRLEGVQPLMDAVGHADPDEQRTAYEDALRLIEQGKFAQSVGPLRELVAQKPTASRYRVALGHALLGMREHQAALECLDPVLKRNPDDLSGLLLKGVALNGLKCSTDALAIFNRMLEIDPACATAYYNRTLSYHNLSRYHEALDSISTAVRLQPDYADAHATRADLALRLNLNEETLYSATRALELDPGNKAGAYCKASILLGKADFAQGWAAMARACGKTWHIDCPEKLWDGSQDLAGKTLVVDTEFGMGDNIQMSRYMLAAKAAGAHVIYRAHQWLAPLMKLVPSMGEIIGMHETPPPFDLHCSIMALPHCFRTTLDTIPFTSRYLDSDATKRAEWESFLGPREPHRPRIGLVWRGNPNHGNDANRSMTLAEFAPHLPAGPQYVSLQQVVGPEDALQLEQRPDITLVGSHLRNYADTAALIDCLDLVISVDTSVAHLSGALGKPTWIMIPVVPEFRWLDTRSDSPWYSSVKLYRQKIPKNWDYVCRSLHFAIRDLMD